ncbi:hypothetical protein KP509_10G065100 [Ceratopteris richardii]|uniref:Uncharacterized protein n=2 Tax=Ceratopteris richardii TaxID=49495 RepID=A0A8T2U1U6_CERRI|nr:hypothetical protein KP509_10G065100 [Ceratopteris richardii]
MSSSRDGEYSYSSPAEVVIAVDFGTTFSGFAFTKAMVTPLEIFDNCQWPGDARAGAVPYCKNQTSLFYIPSSTEPGSFQLKDWGWSAFNAYQKSLSKLTKTLSASIQTHSSSLAASMFQSLSTDVRGPLNLNEEMAYKVGYFAHSFKLYLAPKEKGSRSMPRLPGDLSSERMIVDYLRSMVEFIMAELRTAIRKDFSMKDVQWCLTVPAVWDERAKQQMKICAEKAGMVKGPNCPNDAASSPRALHIILEPEAASAYCQQQAQQNLTLKLGDKILIADVGGGTIDLVVHEIVELHPRGGASKVKEVVASYGDIGGGTFVDARFFDLVSQKIGCFSEYCKNVNPNLEVQMYSWWQGIKADFTGLGYSEEYNLVSCGLSEAWKKYDQEHGVLREDDHYQQLLLTDRDFCSIFDPEIDKVLGLIEKQITNVRVLMVVGGFAGSPYLRKRVNRSFRNRVEEIIIPTAPGRAICRGAVELHMRKTYIKSRISKRTYGIRANRDVEAGDPPDLIETDDDGRLICKDAISIFVRAGEEAEIGNSTEDYYSPSVHDQLSMKIALYSSPRMYPRYTTELDAKKEGSFVLDMAEDVELDKSRKVKVRMIFGDSLINVSALRCNFGSGEEEHGLAVKFQSTGDGDPNPVTNQLANLKFP